MGWWVDLKKIILGKRKLQKHKEPCAPIFETKKIGDDEKIKAAVAKPDEKELRKQLFRVDQEAITAGTFPFSPRFSEKYRIKALLGQGSFGFVFSASALSSEQSVAVKFILKERVQHWEYSKLFDEMVPREVFVLAMIASGETLVGQDKIIKLVDYMSDERYCYMITEYFGIPWTSTNATHSNMIGLKSGWKREQSPGDLFECIEAHAFLPEHIIKGIFEQLVNAVIYLHDAHGVVHRDLKDENVVVNEVYEIKLIDFGSATSLDRQNMHLERFHGTMAFTAPEILKFAGNGQYEALPAEAWSLGVLLYTMVFRKAPFSDPWSIMHHDPPLPLDDCQKPPGIMHNLILIGMFDLLRKMLQKNPQKRIPLHAVRNHPWMLQN